MVKMHGGDKAGQHAKAESNRIVLRYMSASYVFMVLFGVLLGASLVVPLITRVGHLLGPGAAAGVAITVPVLGIGAAAAVLIFRRHFEAYTDAVSHGRMRWLRGGQGEGLVAWHLRDALDGRWHLFNNVKLPGRADYDHVLVGPGGLFCISTRSPRRPASTPCTCPT